MIDIALNLFEKYLSFFLQLKVCLKHCIHITHPHLNEEMILRMFERTICTVLVFHAVNVK